MRGSVDPLILKSMIYTGYFAKLKQYEEKGLIPVAICGKSPDWYKGLKYTKLAPRKDWFITWKSQKKPNAWYIEMYYKTVLNILSKNTVLKDLADLAKDKDIVLLCYEKPTDFCHRHLVASWLKIKEYSEDNI